MTDLLTRPPARAGRQPPRRVSHRSLVLGAALSAAWAAVITLAVVTVVVLVSWATASTKGDAASALRAAGALWLLAQHAPVAIGGVGLTIAPLGATALVGVLLHRRGLALARYLDVTSLRAAWVAAGAIGASYALIVAVVAGGVRGGGTRVDPVAALAWGWLLAVLTAGSGVLRHAPLQARLRARLPQPLRVVTVAAGFAAAGTLALAAAGVALMLGAHVHEAEQLTSALHPGVVGAGGLTVLQAGYVPDAVGWAVAYLTGPGFAVGAGTSVAAGHYLGGPVPAVPLLAALPGAASGWVLPASVLLVAAAGAAAGVQCGRRLRGRPLWQVAGLAAAAGLLAAGVLSAVAALSSGAIGPGRLAAAGPDAALVLGCAALELVPSAAAAAVLTRTWRPGWLPRLRARSG